MQLVSSKNSFKKCSYKYSSIRYRKDRGKNKMLVNTFILGKIISNFAQQPNKKTYVLQNFLTLGEKSLSYRNSSNLSANYAAVHHPVNK